MTYLMIGDGRTARHFRHYFDLEKIPHLCWRRQDGVALLREKAAAASHILLLISDPEIQGFYRAHSFLKDKCCLHFSGALSLPEIPSAHPLMTFADSLYTVETYRRVPFVLERGRGTPAQLLPGLVNPTYVIEPEQKPLYHALCALAGNFTVLLWEKAFAEFGHLGLSKAALVPYLEQIAENLASSPPGPSVLTGPLARGDQATIEKHLSALAGDPYQRVYAAFAEAFAQQKTKKGGRNEDRSGFSKDEGSRPTDLDGHLL